MCDSRIDGDSTLDRNHVRAPCPLKLADGSTCNKRFKRHTDLTRHWKEMPHLQNGDDTSPRNLGMGMDVNTPKTGNDSGTKVNLEVPPVLEMKSTSWKPRLRGLGGRPNIEVPDRGGTWSKHTATRLQALPKFSSPTVLRRETYKLSRSNTTPSTDKPAGRLSGPSYVAPMPILPAIRPISPI